MADKRVLSTEHILTSFSVADTIAKRIIATRTFKQYEAKRPIPLTATARLIPLSLSSFVGHFNSTGTPPDDDDDQSFVSTYTKPGRLFGEEGDQFNPLGLPTKAATFNIIIHV